MDRLASMRSEFEAMVRQKIPVVAVIGNDAAWTQIRRGQVELYGEARAVATELAYTRYDEVVRALGGFGAWVTEAAEVGPALDAAFASGLPACVNVKIGASDFPKGSYQRLTNSLTSPFAKVGRRASPLRSWGRTLSASSGRLHAHGRGL